MTAEQPEGGAIRQHDAPGQPLSPPEPSRSDLAFEAAARRSRQWMASVSPQSARQQALPPRSEAAAPSSEDGESPAQTLVKPGALDPDLRRLIRRWLVLPPRVREAVLALIDATAPR
jgi:hypothetical protein